MTEAERKKSKLEASRRWRAKNLDKVREIGRNYARNHSDRQKANARKNGKSSRERHKLRLTKRRRESYKKAKAFLQEVKESAQPCMDCGRFFPYYAMEFDHRDSKTKVRKNLQSICISVLKKEVLKCDVVCGSCHNIRTHIRRRKK